MSSDARLTADILERAVAGVAKQARRRRFEESRHAVITTLQSRVSAERVLRLVVKHKAGHKQIQTAVVVEIKPRRAGGPTGRGNARFVSHVGERAVAVVTIENVRAVVCDVEIDKTVGIEIRRGHAHPKLAARDTRFMGYVGESSVSVIAIERVFQRRRRREEIRWTTVDEIDVHPTVVVVIEKGAPGADGFGQLAICGLSVVVSPGDLAGLWWNLFKDHREKQCKYEDHRFHD